MRDRGKRTKENAEKTINSEADSDKAGKEGEREEKNRKKKRIRRMLGRGAAGFVLAAAAVTAAAAYFYARKYAVDTSYGILVPGYLEIQIRAAVELLRLLTREDFIRWFLQEFLQALA